MRKKIWIMPLFMVLATLLFFYPALTAKAEQWQEWASQSNVAANKTWTITLSKVVDIATVKAPNIYVVNSNNEQVDVSFAVEDGGKQIVVEPPAANYSVGETYTLYITERVLTNRQQPLLQPTKMRFTVDESTQQETSYDIRPDSEQQVVLQPDVQQLTEQQSEALQFIGDDKIQVKASAQRFDVGDIMLLPATNEHPFGLAREITAITKNANGYLYEVITPDAEDIVSQVDVSQIIPITAANFVAAPGVQMQSPVASLLQHALPSGVASIFNGGDLELSLLQLKMGETYFATGSIVLKNPHFIIDLNDESINLLEDATVVFKTGVDMQAAVGVRAGSETGNLDPSKRNPFEAKFLLGQLYVPIPQFPFLGGKFELYIFVGVDGELRLEVKRALEFEVGGRWTEGDFTKVKNVTLPPEQANSPVPNYSAVMQATAKAGIGVSAAVAVTSEINLASISAEAGAKSMQSVFNYKDTLCYKGTTSLFVEASMQTEAIKRYEWKILGIEKMLQTAEECPYVTQLKVAPEKIELAPDDKFDLHVTKVPLFGRETYTLEDVTFESANPSVVTVDSQGVVHVQPDAKDGTVPITVIYQKGSNFKTATMQVVVKGDEEQQVEGEQPSEQPQQPEQEQEPVVTDNIISVPDTLLQQKIREILKIPTGPIRESDMKELLHLSLYDVEKELDLTGLEYAVKLQYIDVREATSIKNLQAISKLPELRKVYITESELTDLTPLQTIPNIEELNVTGNKLTTIVPVSTMTTLKSLYIDNNNVTDITPLKTLKNLEIFGAGYNTIQSIAPLANLMQLKVLRLWHNDITSIDALKTLPLLHDVVLANNNIKDISPLAGATKMQGLDINQNAVKNIASIRNVTSLITLYADENGISDVSGLKGLTKLKTLSLTNNQIANITPLANLTELTSLSLADNQVKTLDALKNMTKLQFLHLANNDISTIKPIYHISTIERLDLLNNNVSDITLLQQIKALKYLNVRGNPVPYIHLQQFENIPALYLVR